MVHVYPNMFYNEVCYTYKATQCTCKLEKFDIILDATLKHLLWYSLEGSVTWRCFHCVPPWQHLLQSLFEHSVLYNRFNKSMTRIDSFFQKA